MSLARFVPRASASRHSRIARTPIGVAGGYLDSARAAAEVEIGTDLYTRNRFPLFVNQDALDIECGLECQRGFRHLARRDVYAPVIATLPQGSD